MNRIGAENEAVVILFLGFGFVSVGFIQASIRSFRYFKKNSSVRRPLLLLGFILAFCGGGGVKVVTATFRRSTARLSSMFLPLRISTCSQSLSSNLFASPHWISDDFQVQDTPQTSKILLSNTRW